MLKLYISFEERSIVININKNKNLQDLKEKISKEISIESQYFNLKRMGVVKELKEMTMNLVKLGINDKALLKVESGKQHIDGKYELSINLARVLQLQPELENTGTDKSKEERMFGKK
jgi:hypothetical protein